LANRLYCLPFRSNCLGAVNRGCDGSLRSMRFRRAIPPTRASHSNSRWHYSHHTRAPGHGMAAGLPRPEPSPAGKLDEKMKGRRVSALLRQSFSGVFFAGVIALATPCLAPANAWARTAPVTVVYGDPTGGEDSPVPGPSRGMAKTTSSAPTRAKSYTIFSTRSWLMAWRSLHISSWMVFRL